MSKIKHISTKYLQQCKNAAVAADPHLADEVIGDLRNRINKLANHIEKLQAHYPITPERLQSAKNEFAAHYNKTWQKIVDHDFDIGSGLAKQYSFEEMMDVIITEYL